MTHIVNTYFDHKEKNLKRIENLTKNTLYLDIVFLALCCMLDELSNLKYCGNGSVRFKKLLHEYSDVNEFNLIDLLYFFQWQKNSDIEHHAKGYWKKLHKNTTRYDSIKKTLTNKYNLTEEKIKNDSSFRYKSINGVMSLISEDNKKDEEYLRNFTNANVLYYFGRCTSVHEGDTLLLSEYSGEDGAIKFKINHKITPEVLIKTIRKINSKMKQECIKDNKMPWELREKVHE